MGAVGAGGFEDIWQSKLSLVTHLVLNQQLKS